MNTKDCSDALQASSTLASKPSRSTCEFEVAFEMQQDRSRLLEASVIYFCIKCPYIRFGARFVYSCVLEDSRTRLECNVLIERSERRHFDAFTWWRQIFPGGSYMLIYMPWKSSLAGFFICRVSFSFTCLYCAASSTEAF